MVEQGLEKETINNLQNIENLLTNISMKAFLLPDTNVPLMIIDLKNTFNNQTNKQNRKIVEQYNLILKEDKQQRLDAINEHYQSLPDDEQKNLKKK
ncbi:hypothetical protein [Spiroplasma phoeniceum]|uniref:Uncharacterized protein n=1 Tax=Spiroplasma phoeniceum P40 TaxID=1276259 RepID=A0A345DME8_9MOLU|nr:hypothetical protein [Spiroplasma phoeniceum]AXF95386.1 hypothetical protein SDAV_00392 [Spiroplasma phoeniceum P40]